MYGDLMRIGEVARRTGLSLRTIRYYEEMRLVLPSTRTPGGFRLYTEADAQRLNLVKQMKPLEFSLGEVRELLALLDGLGPDLDDGDTPPAVEELTGRLESYRAAAESRCASLRAELASAERFAADLEDTVARRSRAPVRTR